jgi:ActR/RegA family two-component response regulator
MVQVLVVSMDLNRVHHLTGQLLRVLPALKVRSVQSLAEAAELARAMSFRVAFVDLSLAGEGLPVVVGSLRQSLENRFLPVVLVGREDRTAEGAAPASRQVAADIVA